MRPAFSFTVTTPDRQRMGTSSLVAATAKVQDLRVALAGPVHA